MKEQKIRLGDLCFSSNRAHGGEGDIKILAEDIRRNGLINPITVRPPKREGSPMFEVVAGRRRVLAATQLGWREIQCRVLEGDEVGRADEIAGSENINRMAMHPLDEAAIFKQLVETRPIEELAKQFDRAVSEIWQRIQLLSLNDGIKAMFREGKLSLHMAAMLQGLDAEQQDAFVKKFGEKRWCPVNIHDVQNFITSVRHDKLYLCLADGDCAKCKKRTFYSDKALFPELDSEDSLCLDHECYIGKWEKLLAKKIMAAKAKSPDRGHSEASVIFIDDDDLKKIFGKKITVGAADYAVVKQTYDNRPEDKATKASKPCFKLTLDERYSDEEGDEDEAELVSVDLVIKPMYWKEKPKAAPESQSHKKYFDGIVNLLEMPKEVAEPTIAAITKGIKNSWEYSNKASNLVHVAEEKVLERVIEAAKKNPNNEKSIDLMLQEIIRQCSRDKKVLKSFAGTVEIKELKKLPWPKLFTALYAASLSTYDLPNFDQVNSTVKKTEAINWAGVTPAALKAMYKEELAKLMPKVDASTAKEKPSAAKKLAKPKEDSCSACKSAHPDCAKCCAKCKTKCNSSQRCRLEKK